MKNYDFMIELLDDIILKNNISNKRISDSILLSDNDPIFLYFIFRNLKLSYGSLTLLTHNKKYDFYLSLIRKNSLASVLLFGKIKRTIIKKVIPFDFLKRLPITVKEALIILSVLDIKNIDDSYVNYLKKIIESDKRFFCENCYRRKLWSDDFCFEYFSSGIIDCFSIVYFINKLSSKSFCVKYKNKIIEMINNGAIVDDGSILYLNLLIELNSIKLIKKSAFTNCFSAGYFLSSFYHKRYDSFFLSIKHLFLKEPYLAFMFSKMFYDKINLPEFEDVACLDPIICTDFAAEVPGANIKKLQSQIYKYDYGHVFRFAFNVKDADLSHIENWVINANNKYLKKIYFEKFPKSTTLIYC